MLTVPAAARRVRRNPETVRRWIREGKLLARKVGTQHVIDELELDRVARKGEAEVSRLPKEWRRMADGRPTPNAVEAVRRSRESRRRS